MQKQLLIVDDDADLRKLVRKILEFSDFEIHESDNGQDALNFVLHTKPEVVILDIMMPGEIDGFEVCRQIKSNIATAHVRVVLLSALCLKEDLQKGGESGADAYLVKPFSPQSLLDTAKIVGG
ncbi:MAG: response regulator [Piscirickettsiaceae bacterium]|nr:response regulator [Piscirickettsiaceae bacterium]